MYEYSASTLRVIDGDTCELDIDLGMSIHQHRLCRLKGINCPELHGVTLDAGIKSKKRLESLIIGRDLLIKTTIDKSEKYGRLLVDIWIKDDMSKSVNKTLVLEGLAVPYEV